MSTAATSHGVAIARGTLAGWFQLGVALVAGPLYTAMILRALPRPEAAFWLVVLSLGAYFALFDVGLGPTLTRFIAFTRGTGPTPASTTRDASAHPVHIPAASPAAWFATARRLYLGLALALLVLGLFVAPTLFTLGSGLALDGARRQAWTLFVLGCALGVSSAPYYAGAAGLGLVTAQRLGLAGAQALGVTVSAVLLARGWGTSGVATAWLVQNLAMLAGGLWCARRCPELRTGEPFRAELARALFGPSLQWAGINLGAVLILATGPMIIAHQVGPDAVPRFVVLRQLAETIYLLALVPAQMSEPFVARLAAEGDDAAIVALLRRNIRLVGALLIVAMTVAAVLGREVVTAWVGAQHFAGYPALWLMLLLYTLEAHHVVHAIVVMATGRIVFLRFALLAGLITVVTGILFARWWGVPGMIAGMLLAQLATNNWYAPWYSLRCLRVPPGEYLRWLRPLPPLAAIALVLALVTRAALHASAGDVGLPALLGGLSVLGLLLLPAVWRAALTGEERGRLLRGWRRLGAGA